MKSLNTLIRLHKQQLDSLRQELGQWQERRARFVKASQMLADKLRKELEVADIYPEMKGFFGQFSKHIEEQQENIKRQILRVDQQIGLLQEEMFRAFGDMKKYEIARDIQLKRITRQREQQEQAQLDEIGAAIHTQREGEVE